jgi:hypothetical protein
VPQLSKKEVTDRTDENGVDEAGEKKEEEWVFV